MTGDEWIKLFRSQIVAELAAWRVAQQRWSVTALEAHIRTLCHQKHGELKNHSDEFRARWTFAAECEIEREFNCVALTPSVERRAMLRARRTVADWNITNVQRFGHTMSAERRLALLDSEASKERTRLYSDERRAAESGQRQPTHQYEELFT